MSQVLLEKGIRDPILAAIARLIDEEFQSTPLQVSSTSIAFPVVDSEGGEKFAVIQVLVPRGTRDGKPYDGFEEHENFKAEQAAIENKRKVLKQEKDAKERELARKREERANARASKLKKLAADAKQIEENKTEEGEGEGG